MPRRQLTNADRVWNRALSAGGACLREADRALTALLLVDGYIQNGGVSHAFDLAPEELAAGIAGYEFFGLQELSAFIKRHPADEETDCNERYDRLTGRPNLIIAKFEMMLHEHAERFAPVDAAAARAAVDMARSMIDGSTPILLGCRRICGLIDRLAFDREGPFLTFIAVESETDHLPLDPDERKLWNPQVLVAKDRDILSATQWAQEMVLDACKAIIRRFDEAH